ncbi:Disease resistance protein (CC-NBS-LRR class) family [Rhynchospora pubera]|uniref:Disease resistance protein (CC-NBS-LRR class) family n=1 Tax=Rhynchospora pubera TaxID=906938 RepID=A0AAV8F1B4_9POAL|nr:Disease resistance protein (CC-NBS-LRR class) family [Rhynchospora pubera]
MKAILKEKTRLNLQQISINNRYTTTAPIQKSSQSLSSNTCIGATLETDAYYLVNILIREATNEEEEGSHPLMAIVGVDGIGKTTLARKIFNDERIRGSFDIRIWISLSSSLKDTTLLSIIIDAAGGNPGKSTTQDQLKPKLASTITRKRFFLVLDDVSDGSIWNNLLKAPLQAGARGSRILVTAREKNVATQMGVSHVHDVKNLNSDEGWSLLRESSSLEDEDESDILVEIGLNISEQCNGLPLAIKTVGGILKSREPTIKDWLAISESQTWSIEGLPDGTLPVFYLGYEDLSLNLKQCFIYCSMFPKSFCINRHDLIKRWISEGFVVKRDRSTLEETGEEYYRELGERYLIYPEPEYDDTERCKMHDCLVNMARSLSAEDILVDDINKLSEITFRPTHISLMRKGMENIPEEIKTKEKLRTLILAQNPLKDENLRDVFTRLKQLRLLDISETSIEVIPDTLRNLLHLRYLNLSRTNIRELPESIGYLPFLQYLLLQECKSLHSLPKGTEHLKSLRNLDLTGTMIYKFLFRIGKLVNLRSLDFFIVNTTLEPQEENKGWPLGELKNLNKLGSLSILQIDKTRDLDEAKEALLCSKPYLKELELNCSNEAIPSENPIIIQKIEGIIDELCPPPCLEILKIMNYSGTRYPSWLYIDSLSNLRQLELIGCQFCSTLPPIGQLQRLQFLYIANSSLLKDIGHNILGNGQEVAFPKLEKLHIQSLYKLESWTGLEKPGTMPCLKAFQLESCPEIKFLPLCIRHSKSLKELRIIDCKSLETIKNLTRIKELSVWNTPNLRKISNLTSLEDLNISHSPNLKIIKNVNSLKSVHIFDYDIEAIPRWVKTHAFRIQSLDLACSEEMLQRCLVHGPDWDIIQDITHVYGHSNNCTYFLYKKSPFSFETNLSVPSPPQENSSTTETIIIETIDEEILESFSKEESLIINETVIVAVDTRSKEPSSSKPLHLDTPNISMNQISPPTTLIRDNILVKMTQNASGDTDTIGTSTDSLMGQKHRKSNSAEVSIEPDINADTEGSMPSNLAIDTRSKEPSTSKALHLNIPNISMNPISPPITVIRDNNLVNMSENTYSLSNSDTDTISKSTSSLVRRRRRKSDVTKVVSIDADINANTEGSMLSNLAVNSSKDSYTSKPLHLHTTNISMNPIFPPITVIRDNILVNMSENTSGLSNSDTDTISKSTSSLVRRRRRKSNITKFESIDADINADSESLMPSNLAVDTSSKEPSTSKPPTNISMNPISPPTTVIRDGILVNMSENTPSLFISDTDIMSKSTSNLVRQRRRKSNITKVVSIDAGINSDGGSMPSNLSFNFNVRDVLPQLVTFRFCWRLLVSARSLEEEKQPKPLSQSISKTLDSGLAKLGNGAIKVKKNAFSSIGSTSTRNNSNDEKEKETGNSVLSEAIFKQFNSSAVREDLLGIEKDEGQDNSESPVSQSEIEPRFDSGKRKNPFGESSNKCTPRLLVLGDDPKPQLKLKRKKLVSQDNREKPLYNHYANGRGRWDGDSEGVDHEEVGWDEDMWEGMGSIMLGGLDWN